MSYKRQSLGVGGGSIQSKKELLLMVLGEGDGMRALQELFKDNQHLRVAYSSAKHMSDIEEEFSSAVSRSGGWSHHKNESVGDGGGGGGGGGAGGGIRGGGGGGSGGGEKKSWLRRVSTKEWTKERVTSNNADIRTTVPPPPPPANNDDNPKHRLKTLLHKPENLVCADCGAHRPTWGSTNLGVFLCTQCAGVHRSLGVHISAMLSAKLDDWTHEQLDVMEVMGNTRSNSTYEYHVPSMWGKCHPDDEREYRELYIREKYEKKSFMQKERKPPLKKKEPCGPSKQILDSIEGAEGVHKKKEKQHR